MVSTTGFDPVDGSSILSTAVKRKKKEPMRKIDADKLIQMLEGRIKTSKSTIVINDLIAMIEGMCEPTHPSKCGKRCGTCQLLDNRPEAKTSIGYPCLRKNHEWRSNTAHLKYTTTPACVDYKERESKS